MLGNSGKRIFDSISPVLMFLSDHVFNRLCYRDAQGLETLTSGKGSAPAGHLQGVVAAIDHSEGRSRRMANPEQR
jgi:hypothetical protein